MVALPDKPTGMLAAFQPQLFGFDRETRTGGDCFCGREVFRRLNDLFLNRFRERLQLKPILPLSLSFSVNLSRQPLEGVRESERDGMFELYSGV